MVGFSLQFFIWLGSVKWRSTVEIGLIWGNLTASVLTERTFVLQVLYKAPKIADFLHKPQNNPANIWRDSPHIPNCSLHANLPIYFSHRLLGHEKRSSSCSGLQKTFATPAQVWKQIQGFAIAFEHSGDLLQQVRSRGPRCSQDLNQTTCEMATTS